MNWLASIGIALITCVLGLVCSGGIAALCVEWYRISSFEGKSGFFIITIALLGGIAGFLIGLAATRLAAAGVSPGFMKCLGYAAGAVIALALLALGLCRLCADIEPKIDGRELELAVEIRCPKNFALPTVLDEYGATAEVYLPGGRRQPSAPLQLDKAANVDGFLTVTATVPLSTSVSRKFLSVRFDREHSVMFALPSRPDREWSKWFDSAWETGKPEPAKEEKFNARSRVQLVEPPPR
jgi:hypothetical protein